MSHRRLTGRLVVATHNPGKLIEMGPTEKIFATPDVKATEDYITGRFG